MRKKVTYLIVLIVFSVGNSAAQRRESPSSTGRIEVVAANPKVVAELPKSLDPLRLLESGLDRPVVFDASDRRQVAAAKGDPTAIDLYVSHDLRIPELRARLERSNPKWIGDKTGLQMTVKNVSNKTYDGGILYLEIATDVLLGYAATFQSYPARFIFYYSNKPIPPIKPNSEVVMTFDDWGGNELTNFLLKTNGKVFIKPVKIDGQVFFVKKFGGLKVDSLITSAEIKPEKLLTSLK